MRTLQLAFLSLILGLLPRGAHAQSFTIEALQDASAEPYLAFPGQTDSYYQIHFAAHPTGAWTVVDLKPGQPVTLQWTNADFMAAAEAAHYYRVLRVSNSTPQDVDSDGMDDVYELGWSFLDALDGSDAQQDQDGDGLYNYGEYVLHTDPTDQDTDDDFVGDGYEYLKSTSPTNPASAPTLEFRINSAALYTTDTNVSLVFGGLVADEAIVAEAVGMANSVTSTFALPVPYSLQGDLNDWRTLFARLRRTSDDATSEVFSASIILDTEAPGLTITSPTNETVTDQRWVTIEGAATDKVSQVEVRVDGIWADAVDRGSFSRSHVTLDEGSNVVTVTAKDGAGQAVTQEVTIVRDTSGDTTAPSITLELPEDFEIVGIVTNFLGTTTFGSNEVLDFHGFTDDETAEIGIYVGNDILTNGPYAGVLIGTQVWGEVFLEPGTNWLFATASDAAGNVSTAIYTVIRDTSFVFAVTSPSPLEVLSASQTVVSGMASLSFTGATININGIGTTITDNGTNAFFTTVAPVPLSPGLTPLEGLAVLNNRSYYADPAAQSYQYTRWGRIYSNHYSSLYFVGAEHSTVDGWWARDDNWLSSAGELSEHHFQNVTYCDFYIMGGQECESDIRDETVISPLTTPRTYGYFGTENIRYDYIDQGQLAWDRDQVWIHDELGVLWNPSIASADDDVLIHFGSMSYHRPPGVAFVPSNVTFRGAKGFLYSNRVAFATKLTPGIEHLITESDFTWPAYSYFGERTDRRPWYPAGTLTLAHMLSFGDVTLEPLKIKLEPAGFVSSPLIEPVLTVITATERETLVVAFPTGSQGDGHEWVAKATPPVDGTAEIRFERSGSASPVSWNGTPPTLLFTNGTLNRRVVLLEGSGASPVATNDGQVVYIANMRNTDRIIVQHVESGVEGSGIVVKNFDGSDAEDVGLGNLAVSSELSGLPSLVRDNVLNTVRYCLNRASGSEQATERDAIEVLYTPLASLDIPSTFGVGALPGDLMHAHLTYTNGIPGPVATAKAAYQAAESVAKGSLRMGPFVSWIRKSGRDKLAMLEAAMRDDLADLLDVVVTNEGAVLVYHSLEWISDEYGGITPPLKPGDPIRNIMCNLTATDTTTYGAVNDPNVFFPGDTNDANQVYAEFDLETLIDFKFFMTDDGKIKISVSPLGATDTAVRGLQLHEILGE